MVYSLRMLRAEAKTTRKEVAKMLGVHPTTYNKYEENPDLLTLSQVKKLAQFYGVSADIFLPTKQI